MIPPTRKGRPGDRAQPPKLPVKMPKDPKFRLSAVIPLRDRPAKHLDAALGFLAAQRLPMEEVIVVDQASRSKFRQRYAKVCARRGSRNFPVRHVLRSGPPKWNKPMAANFGIRSTSEKATHVLSMDCDMLFAPHAAETFRSLSLGSETDLLVIGHRHDLVDPDRVLKQAAPWSTLERASRLTDRVAHPWHFASREWFFKIRGYDERMWGRGAMDTDLSARAERDNDVTVVRLREQQILAVHYSHGRPPWEQTRKKPETILNRRLRNTDESIVRNDETWGTT